MPDYTLVADDRIGHLVVHTATCPVARQAAADGIPVATLFGAQQIVADMEVDRHDCLAGDSE